jgi:hypothetical protein
LADAAASSGELNLNRNRLSVEGGGGRIGQDGSTVVSKLDVQIADLLNIVVDVTAQLRGNLSDAVQMLKTSPLNSSTDPLCRHWWPLARPGTSFI